LRIGTARVRTGGPIGGSSDFSMVRSGGDRRTPVNGVADPVEPSVLVPTPARMAWQVVADRVRVAPRNGSNAACSMLGDLDALLVGQSA
jgi:hypothetical protein